MTRVAYVSTYVPQKCGLATYTFHLKQAVNGTKNWKGKDVVVVLTRSEEEPTDDPFLWPLRREEKAEYAKMARRINQSDIDVVSLQHEFGIFGGEAGAYILDFLRNLNKPVITTFHTVFSQPQEPYASIQKEIAEKSAKIVVMNRLGIGYLRDAFGIPAEKICYIPHGTPQPNPAGREKWRQQWNWIGRKVLMTFGLLSRGKGLEHMLQILPEVAAKVPDVLYAIVGQTHPEVKKREGEQYREELLEMVKQNGLEEHVVMIDRYLEESDLINCLMGCDLYITPYPGLQQITSGTLAYAVGLGRPVLSTPYAYAADLLKDYPELLLDAGDRNAWADRIVSLLQGNGSLQEWSEKIGKLGKTMHWPEVGRQHATLFAGMKQGEYAHVVF